MKAPKATPTLALLGVLLVAGFRTFVEMVLDDKSTVVVIELLFPLRPRVRRGFFPAKKAHVQLKLVFIPYCDTIKDKTTCNL